MQHYPYCQTTHTQALAHWGGITQYTHSTFPPYAMRYTGVMWICPKRFGHSRPNGKSSGPLTKTSLQTPPLEGGIQASDLQAQNLAWEDLFEKFSQLRYFFTLTEMENGWP